MVSKEVVWWSLRYLDVNEWVVLVIGVMYKDATTTVRLNGRESEALEALSKKFRGGLHMELLYADDLDLMAESDESLNRILRRRKI